ncbi:probable E3 ubiquitin-protein ligase makorin-1 [Chrysoperla carnea]|uniref:probable E3 ubiquitin-protein ligase makorin-1 n=1 Tax=Chrysoperla carnea TaxID=189513 RepID=UPI001D07F364|nr:probable E3 ubiquitin-protein ligase makorin-1 [Chrysoperla carnea]
MNSAMHPPQTASNSRLNNATITTAPQNNSSTPSLICRFHKHGTCKYGTQCRFVHQTSSPTSSSSDNINSTTTPEQIPPVITRTAIPSEDWVNAPEFFPSASKTNLNTANNTTIPKKMAIKSYAQVVKPEGKDGEDTAAASSAMYNKLCPYAEANGECRYPPNECSYIHGDICELCGVAALHPHDQEQRKRHQRECVSQHEKNMELSFAVARSREKSCGVCFEVILEKSSREQRFGILPNCNHCFCLSCIRKWRQAKQFDSKIIRACPECRVTSDFVCPSMYWVDTKEEKEKLITDYKGALRIKDCKYFKQGRGKCPFGNKCFYLHALPDGTKVDVGPPVRHRRQAHDGEIDMLQQFILWDFLEDRDNRWLYSLDDLEDLVAFFSDSEDSDWSEYDFSFE